MNLQEKREQFITLTKQQLIGTQLKDNLLVGETPLKRFFTGFLFPILSTEIEEEIDSTLEPKKMNRYIPPSSAGFSFFIVGQNIKLRVFYSAVSYTDKDNRDEFNQKFVKQVWEKSYLADDGKEVEFSLNGAKQYKIFDKKARIDALWRPYREGYIVTITMSNNKKIDPNITGKKFHLEQNRHTLFEVEFKCIVEEGIIDVYPAKDKALLTEEEKEIELRYKDLYIYAIGHGTAVNWKRNKHSKMEIWTDFLPTVEVPQVTADTGGNTDKVLEFNFLQNCEEDDSVIDTLNIFVNDYDAWILNQEIQANQEEDEDKETAKEIVKKLSMAKTRMQQGVDLLKSDKNAMISFAVANEAMLKQWISGDSNRGIEKDLLEYKWRPFQLAFILMTLESTTNEESDFRDTLDLIWFPTGGGKTEAYLGLMAFLFIYRRLKYPDSSGGTVSIMRYTLRLLTSQQFLRASKVICALELIRQEKEGILGREPFSIGLWVGSASSPNNFRQVTKILEDKQYSKLVLHACPWCNTTFIEKNYILTQNSFHFTCHHNMCDFGKVLDNVIPCNVVDEALYINPPSLLIATVDKFARLTWEESAGHFFGKGNNRPPELIIQDELHLIASALGSIVGLYEVAIETVLLSRGMRAKYIASTATIKNAQKQVQTLFAKEMAIFPPSGLRYDDSYFAKTIPLEKKAGRMYIGYLAPLLDRQHCLEPLAGVLLSNPIHLFKDDEQYMDKWWTQIVYHGSLKGVGNSRTLYQSGIKSYLTKFTIESMKKEIDEHYPDFLDSKNLKGFDDFKKIDNPNVKAIVDKYLPLRDIEVKTLTSNQTAEENAGIFEALGKNKDDNQAIDVALATNMISVGLDVSRLALMIINGQPLTTAEYIQASSRVGRGETPGMVFINYYKTQARSLSHYENFRSYHDSFYRFVEPSSLTPFTFQARSRALHSALVIAIRHSDIGLSCNDKAGELNMESDEVKKVIKEMKYRCTLAIGNNKEIIKKVENHIDKLLKEWENEADYCKKNKIKLVYNSKDRGSNNLICNFEEKNGLWQTLQSMRNVESSALVKILKGVKLKDEA
ncbi:MAG: helicase-related protein [Sulfurovum sp.]|nr:helicase-related protein [Sulfurovum sp.]